MDISGVTSIATVALSQKNQDFALQLSAAVAKQAIEQQKREGAALVEMVQQTNIVQDGHVDIYA